MIVKGGVIASTERTRPTPTLIQLTGSPSCEQVQSVLWKYQIEVVQDYVGEHGRFIRLKGRGIDNVNEANRELNRRYQAVLRYHDSYDFYQLISTDTFD